MDAATQILVIIVSSILTIFLIAAIVLIVIAIKLMKKLKSIADQAENAIDKVATAGDALRNASGPLAIAKMVRNLVKNYKSGK